MSNDSDDKENTKSNTYSEVPGVMVSVEDEDMLTPGPTGHRYVHIDQFEKHDQPGVSLHLYAFESDDKKGELLDTADELQQDFIATTCIIWPDEIRGEVEKADTERMRALEWAYALMPYMTVEAEDLSVTADQVEQHIG